MTLTWRQWLDLRWLDLRYLLLDANETPLREFLVGLGLVVLAAGTVVWLVGCARVAWNGRPWAAIPLAGGGLMLSLSAVAVPIAWFFYTFPVARTVFGIQVVRPDLTWLPDDAVGWIPLGLGLGVVGMGLAAIQDRRRGYPGPGGGRADAVDGARAGRRAARRGGTG